MTPNPEVGGSAAGTFHLTESEDGWLLTMERRVGTNCEGLWECLTEPSQLARWAPFTANRPLTEAGPVRLAAAHVEESDARAGSVIQAEAPRHLVFDWGPDTLRWMLEPDQGGTRLTLQHRFSERGQAPAYAAGWQLCLKGLVELGEGGHPPVMVGERALEYGWMDWYVWYARHWHMEPF